MNYYITDFEKKRQFFRLFYLYGAYSITQLIAKTAMSKRACEDEVKRFRYFSGEHLAVNKSGKVKFHGVKWDRYCDQKNILFRAYKAWSCKENDISYYIMLMCVLGKNASEQKSVLSLKGEIDELFGDEDFSHQGPAFTLKGEAVKIYKSVAGNQIYERLDDLVKLGIVRKAEAGDNDYLPEYADDIPSGKDAVHYWLADTVDSGINYNEMLALYCTLDFYRNAVPLQASACFVQDAVKNISVCDPHRIKTDEGDRNYQGVFLFYDMYAQNILDDDLMVMTEEAIETHRCMMITYRDVSNANIIDRDPDCLDDFDKLPETVIIPLKIIYDNMHGIYYLYFFDKTEKRRKSIRLNHIYSYELTDESFVPDDYKELYDMLDGYFVGNHTQLGYDGAGYNERKTVEIDILPDDDGKVNRSVLSRIRREAGSDKLHKISENSYLLKTEVYQPLEMIPWIRSFGRYMRVRKSDEHDLYERIHNDWKEALKKYEAL